MKVLEAEVQIEVAFYDVDAMQVTCARRPA